VNEVFVSVDIESDGPIPGPNSMLSFGAAAFIEPEKLVGTFSANLELLEGAVGDPKTMKWWLEEQKEAWAECRKNLESPITAMKNFISWVEKLPGKPVLVAYPAGYDFNFMYWYMIRFAGQSPFSFSALDIKTYAMAVLKTSYRESTKKQMPKRWFSPAEKHTHVALDDAKEQGVLFMRMMAENKANR